MENIGLFIAKMANVKDLVKELEQSLIEDRIGFINGKEDVSEKTKAFIVLLATKFSTEGKELEEVIKDKDRINRQEEFFKPNPQ